MTDRADPTFGLNSQALAILHMLAGREPDFATYTNGRYNIDVQTFPWYNGRERGVCLVVRHSLGSLRALHVAFGEERMSDAIFVDTWEDDLPNNSPTLEGANQEVYDKAYRDRKHFNYGRVGDAAEFVYEAMRCYYEAQAEKGGSK
jgi:hypothetical protein